MKKGMDISCASHSSTAVFRSTTTGRPSSSSSSCSWSSATTEQHLGGRAIDRHNPIISDSRRTLRSLTLPAPCASSLPISPVPYRQLRTDAKKGNSLSYSSGNERLQGKQDGASSPTGPSPRNIFTRSFSCSSDPIRKKLGSKYGCSSFKSPPGSSRCLLSEPNVAEGPSHAPNLVSKWRDSLVNSHQKGGKADPNQNDQSVGPNPAAAGSEPLSNQVVVMLRVSLHCRGCEGKVRKHLSRMAGVTSFNIDYATKKVTVVGDVTADGVLSSVSRVKYAQFWTSPAAAA